MKTLKGDKYDGERLHDAFHFEFPLKKLHVYL